MNHDRQLTQISTANRRFNIAVASFGVLMLIVGLLLLRLDFTINATAEVYREGSVKVYAPRAGSISAVYLNTGEVVAEGEPVLELDVSAERREMVDYNLESLSARHQIQLLRYALQRVGKTPADMVLATAPERLEIRRELMSMRSDTLERFEGLDAMRAISGLQIQSERMNQLRDRIGLIEDEFLNRLGEEGFLDAERERTQLEIEQLEERLELLDQRIAALQDDIEQGTVRAPVDGVISQMLYDDRGEYVEAGIELFQVTDPSKPPYIRAFAPQRNIDLVNPGALVRLSSNVFDSPLEGYVEGEVAWVAMQPDPEQSASAAGPVYEVRIGVNETPYPLVLGSTLEAEIVIGKRNLMDALLRRRTDRVGGQSNE